MVKTDFSLTESLIQGIFARLAWRERQVLRTLVAFDVFVYPRLVAALLGIPAREVHASLSTLRATGLIRNTEEGSVGMTYQVLREIFPPEWRLPSPIDALRMAALLVNTTDWYAISRRAELHVLGGRLEDAARDFERAAIEASHRGHHADARSLFMKAAKTAREAAASPAYVPDASEDEDTLERTAIRCRKRAHQEYKKNVRAQRKP